MQKRVPKFTKAIFCVCFYSLTPNEASDKAPGFFGDRHVTEYGSFHAAADV